MRLYWGSIALQLAFQIAWYGNVSYSTLKLYPYPYESTKDAVQMLIRAGFVGIVKAPHVKSLYITPQGRAAVDEARMKHRRDAMEKAPIPSCVNAFRVCEPLKYRSRSRLRL